MDGPRPSFKTLCPPINASDGVLSHIVLQHYTPGETAAETEESPYFAAAWFAIRNAERCAEAARVWSFPTAGSGFEPSPRVWGGGGTVADPMTKRKHRRVGDPAAGQEHVATRTVLTRPARGRTAMCCPPPPSPSQGGPGILRRLAAAGAEGVRAAGAEVGLRLRVPPPGRARRPGGAAGAWRCVVEQIGLAPTFQLADNGKRGNKTYANTP